MNKAFIICLMSLFSLHLAQGQITVRGTVTDATDGTPLPGVNVVIQGTTDGTTTDFDGNYTIQAAEGSILEFSFIGFLSAEVAAADQVDVALQLDNQQLEEVVLTGYGVSRKKDLTGAVDKISTEEFNQGAIVSPEQLIAAKTPGVQISTGSGAAGSGSQIRIRGGSSLNASNNPLIVVDGVPLDVDGAGLNAINPNDIEDFTVLKDASATAIYGSRGSNGVIIITTKKGRKNQELQAQFSSRVSLSDPVQRLDLLSTSQINSIKPDGVTLGNENTDWQDQIYRQAYAFLNDLSVQGGGKNIDYRLSLNKVIQDGILKEDSFDKSNVNLSVGFRLLDDKLRVRINSINTSIRNDYSNEGAIGSAISFDPSRPITNGSAFGGFYEWLDQNGVPNNLAPRNPVGLLSNRSNTALTGRYIGNFNLNYYFLDGFKATFISGYDYSEQNGNQRIEGNAASNYRSETSNGFVGSFQNVTKSRFMDSYVNYTKDIASVNGRVDATAGYTFQQFYRHGRFNNTDLQANESQNREDLGLSSENWLESYFTRVFFSYADKYSITATARLDKSSRFSTENQTGFFPSAAAAWTISEESFLQNSNVVSNLKLRLGWGITGQQELNNDFGYLGLYTAGGPRAQYQLGDTFYTTLRPEGYDLNIKWEETTTLNVGLDFGFLNDRISGSIDAYQKTTTDLLNFITPPAGSNLENGIITNIGAMDSKGLEAALSIIPIQNDKLTWNVDMNISFQEREITKLTLNDDPSFKGVLTGGIAGGVGNTVQIHAQGNTPNSFFLYEQVYDTTGRPLEGVYVDQNADGVINDDDKVIRGDTDPDFYFGFSSNLTYGAFDLGFTVRGSVGNYMYNNVNSSNGSAQSLFGNEIVRNVTTDFLNTGFERAQYWSDYYLQDASYLKLDNLTLGYNVNEKLRFYVTGQNLLVVTNYDGIDPEIPGGIDNNVYPRPTNYLFGLDFKF